MSKIQIRRLFEKEYLLRYNKYNSNKYSNDQTDLPWNSNDWDVHHEHTRRRGTQKYLGESCYHHIECTVASFLTALMWRKPLNSAVLVTITHKKSKRVSDEISTQIRAQMTDKCWIKIDQRELYNVRDPPWGGGKNWEKEHCSNQNCTCTLFSWFIWTLASSDKKFIHISTSYLCMTVIQFHISHCPIH